MKKIATFFILLAFLKTQAQTYQRMIADSLTTFYVANVTPGVVHPGPGNGGLQSSNCLNVNSDYWYIKTDSIYKALTYKKVSYTYSSFIGLIREDSVAKKVYFIPHCDTNEVLLYDFSLTAGSTITYSFVSGSFMSNGVYTVDSVKFKHDYKTFYHKHFYLRNHTSVGNPVLEIVEGVGQLNHPLFLYYSFQQGELFGGSTCPPSKFNFVISCKWDNGAKIYIDSCAYKLALTNGCVNVIDTCNYGNRCTSIEEFAGIRDLSVYPNPASEFLTAEIESEKEMTLSYSLINFLGIEVKKEKTFSVQKGKNHLQINVKDLPEGVYILKLSNESNTGGKTIIISR